MISLIKKGRKIICESDDNVVCCEFKRSERTDIIDHLVLDHKILFIGMGKVINDFIKSKDTPYIKISKNE